MKHVRDKLNNQECYKNTNIANLKASNCSETIPISAIDTLSASAAYRVSWVEHGSCFSEAESEQVHSKFITIKTEFMLIGSKQFLLILSQSSRCSQLTIFKLASSLPQNHF